MKRTTKIAIGTLLGIGVVALGLLLLNNYLEKRIGDSIDQHLQTANGTYEKIDVKLLNRRAEIVQAVFTLKNKSFRVERLLVDDIHLWDLVFNEEVIIGSLEISNPQVKFYPSNTKQQDSSSAKSKSEKLEKKLSVKQLMVTGGNIQVFDKDSSQHRLFARIANLSLQQVSMDSESLRERIPIKYEAIELNIDSLYYDLNDQQNLGVGRLYLNEQNILLKDLQIRPKYSKAEHQKTISVEKDRYDLKIDTVSINDFQYEVVQDSVKASFSHIGISGANLDIYRDKLQPDDTSFKPLYSKMIRELPFLISLDSMSISRSYIEYEEKIHADRPAGVVNFSNLHAQIKNITNIDLDRPDFPETVVVANANFMKHAPLRMELRFAVNDASDRFRVSGNLGNIGAEQMNSFMRPAMNVEASGEILDMYFNFYGNDTRASGDMKLEYNDFKVEVLRKDGDKKNKVVSALANLIVKNKAINKKANYKEISYTRDKTKSFWNYLWNLIKNGALKSFL